MRAPTPLGELVDALADGLWQPRHVGEVLVIVLALAAGLLLARVLSRAITRRHTPALAGVPAAPAHLRRLLFPLLALVFLAAGGLVLRLAHMVSGPADAQLLRLAVSLVVTLAVVRILLALLRRVFRSTTWMSRFERLIGAVALVVAGLYLTGVLGDVVDWLDGTKIPLGASNHVTLWSVLLGGCTTLVALLAAMWAGSLFEDRLAVETEMDPNLRTVLGRVVRALLLVFAILLALGLSGIDLTVLSVFGGALGVGLGLGLQRIASNYVSGFILLLDRSLRIGDVITVDKYSGQVTQISTRYTVLRASDGTEAVIPNEMLVSSPVINATLGDPRIVLALTVTIGPQEDLDCAMRLLREAAAAQSRVLSTPAPVALLREFQGGNLVLECNFWIGDPHEGRQNIISDVAVAVHRLFLANGIALAVPRGEYALAAPAVLPAAVVADFTAAAPATPAGARPRVVPERTA
jgi:small-conductance mechanosensitive channel